MKPSSLFRPALVAAVVVSLAAFPVSAQSVADAPSSSEVSVETPKQMPSLVTDAAARVGIARIETAATANALAAQQRSETTRWIIIIAVGVLVALLIMAVVN